MSLPQAEPPPPSAEHEDVSLANQLTLNAPPGPPPEPVRHVVNAERKHVLRGHAGGVQALAFSPDSLRLATGSEDKTVRLWSVDTGILQQIFAGHNGKVHGLTFIGSGTILFSCSKDKSIIEWDLLRSEHRRTLKGHDATVWSVCIVQEGQVAVSVSHDESIRSWDTMSGQLLHTLAGGQGTPHHTSTIYVIKASPGDNQFLATGSADKSVHIYKTDDKQLVQVLHGHTSHVLSVAWLPDGKGVVSGSWDETIKVWDLATGEAAVTLTANTKVNAVAVSPDGDCIASGGEDRMVRLWRISTQECFLTLDGHDDEVAAVTFSPDGRFLASSDNDGTVITYRTARL